MKQACECCLRAVLGNSTARSREAAVAIGQRSGVCVTLQSHIAGGNPPDNERVDLSYCGR